MDGLEGPDVRKLTLASGIVRSLIVFTTYIPGIEASWNYLYVLQTDSSAVTIHCLPVGTTHMFISSPSNSDCLLLGAFRCETSVPIVLYHFGTNTARVVGGVGDPTTRAACIFL